MSAPGRDAAATRDRLLAAAEEEFAAHGFRGARVQEIVARASVNERMLYHHFGDKEGLYRAIFLRFGETVGVDFEAALDAPGSPDPVDRLAEMLRRYFDTIVARPNLVRIVMHEALAGWPLLAHLQSDADDHLSIKIYAFFAEAKAVGALRADVDPLMALLVAGGAFFTLPLTLPRMQRLFTEPLGDPTVLAALRERIIDTILRGVVAPR